MKGEKPQQQLSTSAFAETGNPICWVKLNELYPIDWWYIGVRWNEAYDIMHTHGLLQGYFSEPGETSESWFRPSDFFQGLTSE